MPRVAADQIKRFYLNPAGDRTHPVRNVLALYTSFGLQQRGQHADRLPLVGDCFVLRRQFPADAQAIFAGYQSRGCAQFFSTIPTAFRIPGRHFGASLSAPAVPLSWFCVC